VVCIYAGAIERRKMRADFGIPYDVDTLKLIDDLREWGLHVQAVVITRFEDQPSARVFKHRLERRNVPVYAHRSTLGYPPTWSVSSAPKVTARTTTSRRRGPSSWWRSRPGSGKLATCLSQDYHECLRGNAAGYAKDRDLPHLEPTPQASGQRGLRAATVELHDINQIDPFHLSAYGQQAINYNRDIEAFPVVARILQRIGGDGIYKSPTDMGVNRAGFAIVDDEVVRRAAEQEVIRRYFRYACEYAVGLVDREDAERAQLIMEELGLTEDHVVVAPSREAAAEAEMEGKGNEGIYCGAAIELPDGRIATGKNSALMHAASAAVINAVKLLSGIPLDMPLLTTHVLESIATMKKNVMRMSSVSLDLDECMIVLGISGTNQPSSREGRQVPHPTRGVRVPHHPSADRWRRSRPSPPGPQRHQRSSLRLPFAGRRLRLQPSASAQRTALKSSKRWSVRRPQESTAQALDTQRFIQEKSTTSGTPWAMAAPSTRSPAGWTHRWSPCWDIERWATDCAPCSSRTGSCARARRSR
jgi:uncharacterized protein (UPF0371 family)